MIRFTRVSKRFGSTLALEDVDWEVAAGERVAVLGASGAGKTTLLRLVTMEILPTTGTVEVAGFVAARAGRARRQLLRRSFGIIFEDLRLLPDRTVFENLAVVLNLRGLWDKKQIETRVGAALAEIGMETRAAAFPGELSAGERQRVAVARALVSEPLLILADEPTRHLGPRHAERLLGVLLGAHQRGATLVLATNDDWVAQTLGGRVTRMAAGRVEEDAGAAVVQART